MKSQSIPCELVMERLWTFIDRELDTASEAEVREHLRMCGRCYPRYDFQQAYFRLMRRLTTEPAPSELRSRVFRTLLAETG